MEGGHLKSNYGYLESSLDISAFHYLVQTPLSVDKTNDGSMAICLYPHILASVRGWRADCTANTTARIFSLNSSLINKSSFFICPLTARTPRTFLQINCGWFLIPAVIVIDSEITEEKAYKLLSDRVEEREAALKHPDFNIRGGGAGDNSKYVMVLTGGGREGGITITLSVQHNEWSWPLIHSIWQLTYTWS